MPENITLPEPDLRTQMMELLNDFGGADAFDGHQEVFCNRPLQLGGVEHIGFDMDYTLARYHQNALEELTLKITLKHLVEKNNYPKDIMEIKPRPGFAIRGLVVDRLRGNLFKLDRHRHVNKAFHGYRPLNPEEVSKEYHQTGIRFTTSRYRLIDTLFGLPEVYLFAGLIDHFENSEGGLQMTFEELYDDIRNAVDLAHRNDSLKKEIIADLPRYIVRDPELARTLHRFRSAGKHLFLMTNSYWKYTDQVMGFLLNDTLPEYSQWRSYFDVILTGAQKPSFFASKAPFLLLDEDGNVLKPESKSFEKGKVYQGGHIQALEKMLGSGGPTILYVGDHIYGDILKSKKVSSWRTCMIVQEMEEELSKRELMRDQISEHYELHHELSRLDSELYFIRNFQRRTEGLEEEMQRQILSGELSENSPQDIELIHALRRLRQRQRALKQRRQKAQSLRSVLNEEIERSFNVYWGLIFKEGAETSIFGKQVRDYACLYTSKVSNLVVYSPLHNFTAPLTGMPHER